MDQELEILRSVLEELKHKLSEIPESDEKIDLQDPDLVIVTSGSGMKSPSRRGDTQGSRY